MRLALLVLLGGCGYSSDGLARLETLYPTPQPIDAGERLPIDLGTPECSGYAGTWAVRLVQTGTIAPLVEPWKMTLTDLFLAESDGHALTLRFCDQLSNIVTSGGATDLGRTRVPDTLKAALSQRPVTLTLPASGEFRVDEVVWLWGLTGVGKDDLLPDHDTWVGDSRVWDEDGDGQPGVTMGIVSPEGDRYLVRRAVWAWGPGRLTLDNQWLTGALTSRVDERALGASNSLLLTPAPITMKTAGTVYQLRCVGSTYRCADLGRDQAEVFKNAP